MDLDTRNLIFRLEKSRKRIAQKIIDTPELADQCKVGSAIDALGKTIHQLRSGQLTCEEFMESLSER